MEGRQSLLEQRLGHRPYYGECSGSVTQRYLQGLELRELASTKGKKGLLVVLVLAAQVQGADLVEDGRPSHISPEEGVLHACVSLTSRRLSRWPAGACPPPSCLNRALTLRPCMCLGAG
jgi:hypothetical protein